MDQTSVLQTETYPVIVTRKRMKNLYLRVLPPDGTITVSAPLYVSEEQILRFVESRADWILKQRRKVLSAQRPALEDTAVVPCFGRMLTLCVVPVAGRTKVERIGETLRLSIRPEADEQARKKALDGWYRTQLLAKAQEMLPDCERTVGKRAGELRIRDMKTRWGTCNVRTALVTINLRLAEKPPECLRYVLIHELCHLHVAGHGEQFWRRMDVYYPDWKRVRKLLKNR
ncbi:MAG: SprT family zinc-dependent metalloprotease [Eubacteriales bacterium]|nr:SprT family zinc-dependent metalloprotease [Eubacteriales bacterium]